MDDLTAFLRARLDEDAATARAATPGPWWYNPGKQWLEGEAFESWDLSKGLEFVGHGGPHPFTGAVAGTGPADHPQSMADAAHISRHDPARVLAEVDAKRRIIAQWEDVRTQARNPISAANYQAVRIEQGALADVLRLFALAYADHPDYRKEWTP